jgi:hypothetical protein
MPYKLVCHFFSDLGAIIKTPQYKEFSIDKGRTTLYLSMKISLVDFYIIQHTVRDSIVFVKNHSQIDISNALLIEGLFFKALNELKKTDAENEYAWANMILTLKTFRLNNKSLLKIYTGKNKSLEFFKKILLSN